MQKTINISVCDKVLTGSLVVPENAIGLVLFSHGSGSGRLSPRNRFVAEVLQKALFATLLVDLLTEEEDQSYQNRFDIELLTKRLIEIVKWLKLKSQTQILPIGLFGASTGAAAALKCAAKMDNIVKAVVSRGGRPDLAGQFLSQVQSPTLLIVGGKDTEVLTLNEQAYVNLKCVRNLEIVPNATHLFEEDGALEKVSALARDWFLHYVGAIKIITP